MNSVLRELLDSNKVKRPDGSFVALESNITLKDGLFIQQILTELRPTLTLEIGMAYGISTLFICDTLASIADAKHIVIDPYQNHVPNTKLGSESQPADPGWEGLGLYNIKRAGYSEMVDFHEEPSYLALPDLVAEGTKIDFAFIDGMHTFDYVLLDFFYVDLLLNIGGVIIFDDVNYASIRKVCRFILQNRAYVAVLNDTQKPPRMSLSKRIFLSFNAVGKYIKPEFLVSDSELGIFGQRQLCLRKLRDDKLMLKETSEYRNWATHRDF